ncbi:hypothetical protein BC940DRAFT_302571 [Gongronella butleri]|nr:hypothetical protein BC940DRAFT_302571 [Gongronella butleri]
MKRVDVNSLALNLPLYRIHALRVLAIPPSHTPLIPLIHIYVCIMTIYSPLPCFVLYFLSCHASSPPEKKKKNAPRASFYFSAVFLYCPAIPCLSVSIHLFFLYNHPSPPSVSLSLSTLFIGSEFTSFFI